MSGAWVRRVRFAYEMAAPRRYLLVMSHMRSYSSLLSHILNSHQDIDGYVEMHKPYRGDLDLVELALRVRHSTGERLRGRYVMDKVLHNYSVAPNVLHRRDVFTVFSIREPEQTVRSIIAMGLRREQLDWKSNPEKVVNHYVKRLDTLAEVIKRKPHNSVYFEADQLIHNTDETLRVLSSYLELATPLRGSYETSSLTGKAGYGDPSQYIGTGQIVARRDDYSHIHVPDALMTKAHRAYERNGALLAKRANITIGADAATSAPDLDQLT